MGIANFYYPKKGQKNPLDKPSTQTEQSGSLPTVPSTYNQRYPTQEEWERILHKTGHIYAVLYV